MARSSWMAAAALGAAGVVTTWSAGSADRGEMLFQQMCTGCHATDTSKEGPKLRGVFGRKAAGVAGFPYSESLQNAKITWNEATLDKWLDDPTTIAGETDMAFRLADAQKRADLIAYLKTLK